METQETETSKETKSEEVESREYGFTVMVTKDGKINLTGHNLANDFEFAGLVEFVSQQKNNTFKILGSSLEARTLQSIGTLAKVLLENASQSQETNKAG